MAETKEEFEQAFRLMHDCNPRARHSPGLYLSVFHSLPETRVLIAVREGTVLATLTVIPKNRYGFAMDQAFDTSAFKRYGARVAEVTGLAFIRELPCKRDAVLFLLFKYLYQSCLTYFGVDCILTTVRLKDCLFYQGVLLFDRMAKASTRHELFSSQTVGLHLHLRECYGRYAELYGTKSRDRDLFDYFTSADPALLLSPKKTLRKPTDPNMSPELLDYFFNVQTDFFSKLTERERSLLLGLYNKKSAYGKVLPKVDSRSKFLYRSDRRYTLPCSGKITLGLGNRVVSIEVHNVSRNGFSASLGEPIRFGDSLSVSIFADGRPVVQLQAYPVWSHELVYGFNIASCTPDWEKLIASQQQGTTSTKRVA
ncbi:MAG: hypothetical protein HY537_18740 [Deltaproteobacteria bacterium]|nr:hypothetical protein [Deltaproteobacteria bacterium]